MRSTTEKLAPTKTLPANYTRQTTLDLSNRVSLLLLNLAALGLFTLCGMAFCLAALRLRADFDLMTLFDWPIVSLFLLLAAIPVTLSVHEIIHGVFFWLYTRERPRFGFKGAYAYAAAPDWYLPRNQHIVVGLAPLIVISLGILLAAWLPLAALPILIVCTTFNAAGAVGDLATVAWELTRARQAYVRDRGDIFEVYEP